ncbi:MAG: hypothetical protein ACE5EM_07540 [Sphingomonadales bacterium]
MLNKRLRHFAELAMVSALIVILQPTRAALAANDTTPAETPVDSLEPFDLGSLSDFSAIIERPVFSRTRRFPHLSRSAPAQTAVRRTTVKQGSFKLAGVVMLGETKYALLKHKDDSEYSRIEEGSTLHNWQLEAIRPGEVVLIHNGLQDIVELSENAPTGVERRKAQRKSVTARQQSARRSSARRRAQQSKSNFVRSLAASGGSRVTMPGAQSPRPATRTQSVRRPATGKTATQQRGPDAGRDR